MIENVNRSCVFFSFMYISTIGNNDFEIVFLMEVFNQDFTTLKASQTLSLQQY